MDWMNRGVRQNQSISQPVGHPTGQPTGSRSKRFKDQGWLRITFITLLFSGTLLLVSLLLYTAFGGKPTEGKYVDSSKYQAVFLNGGQVYFGHVKTLNNKFVRVSDIYYLRVNQQVQPNQSNNTSGNDVTLVKLGCELHGPQDQMLINRDQVIFWENLKTDGQVAKAIAKFVSDNPNGQNCTTAAQSSNSPASTTTTTPTTKKP